MRRPNDRIWIPSVQRQEASQRSSDCDPNVMDVVNEMRYLVLAESLSGVDVSRFRESRNLPNTPQLEMRLTRHTSLEAIAYLTFKKIQHFMKDQRPKAGITPQSNFISIACQPPKVRVLTDLLLSSGIAINFIDFDELAAKCRSGQPGTERRMQRSSSSITSTTALNDFVTAFGYRLQELSKRRQTKSSDYGSMLITDRESDGVGRTLINSFCRAQKAVFLVPEGATYFAEQIETNAPFFRATFSRAENSYVTRCVVSETALKQERRKNPEQEILISGYLGKASRRFLDVFGTKLLKLWIRFIKFTRRCDYIVFVVPEIGTDWGSPVNHLEMRSFQLLMNTLCKQRIVVVLKLRHGELISTIGQRWPRSLLFQKVPWTWLARACDVTIQTDSSIGIEAVSELGMPLAIWNPYSRTYSSHQWLDIAETGVKEISDPATLIADLARLRMERPTRNVLSQFYADPFKGALAVVRRITKLGAQTSTIRSCVT